MKVTKWLLFLTLSCLPAYIIRCRTFDFCEAISPIPLTFLEIAILASFGSWVVWKYQDIKKSNDSLPRLLQRLKSPIIWPILFFLLSAVISTFISSDLRGAAGILKAYFLEGFLLYIVIVDFLLITRQFYFLVFAFLLSGLWLSVISLGEWVSKVNPAAPNELVRGRVSGVYSSANALGLYLGPLFIFSLGLLFQLKKRSSKLLIALVSALLFLGIWVSGSRGALLGVSLAAILGILFLIFKSMNLPKKWFSWLVLGSVSLGTISMVLIIFNISSLITKSPPKNSFEARLCLWEGTKNFLKEKPIFGSGLNGFLRDYPAHRTCSREINEYPHNFILNFWTQLGILGLISFLWICFTYSRKLLSSERFRFLSIFLVLSLVGIFGHGLVDVPFFKNDLSAQFWILLAFGTYLIRVQAVVGEETLLLRQ